MGKKKELTYLEAMSEIISGIGIYESVSGYPDIRRASHISEWAEGEANRLNPENGLCLSATYDAAFDRHLISFDEHYRLIVSKAIKDQYTDAAAKSYLSCRKNGEIFVWADFSFIGRCAACVFDERKDHAYAVA